MSETPLQQAPLLEVSNLNKSFSYRTVQGEAGILRAVENVSFTLNRGETLGLVGESGSGKTTTGRCLLYLTPPDSGEILYEGQPITAKTIKNYRSKMQLIFQNPSGSLDPRMRVRRILAEGLRAAENPVPRKDEEARLCELLEEVGLSPDDLDRYPHELSGGQQQRVGIARTLAAEPAFLVCDEPVSALDVSYQAQIINLLQELKAEHGLSYLFISHDLSVISHIADRIAVMYLGRIVEYGSRDDVLSQPMHPYTKSLIASIPIADPVQAKEKVHNASEFPAPAKEGCPFRPRCPYAKDICSTEKPLLHAVSSGHFCECHLCEPADE